MSDKEGLGKPRDSSPPDTCPDNEVWPAVCTGRVSETEADALLAHAADCGRCGLLLREASDLFRKEATDDEERLLRQLQSANDKWQRRVGGELAKASRTTQPAISPVRWPRLRAAVWPTLVAASLAAGSIALWIYRNDHSIDRLLADAYDRQRLTELRIPGGQPVPMYSPARGNRSEEPTELLEARLAAERGLEKDSTSASWHQVLGQIDVIEMDPKSALAQLQMAVIRNPRLSRIEFDLGTAYFELGESGGDMSNFGYAAEHFSRYLNGVQGRDPVALYDRALCWERTGVPELATKDLTEALRFEKNPGWRRVIEEQLRSLSTPASLGPQSKEVPDTQEAERYEDLLTVALEDQITNYSSEARNRLRLLADTGEMHRDAWLHDWIAASLRKRSPQADKALSVAIRENLAGDTSRGIRDSLLARRFYLKAGNTPGMLRAEAEEIYAIRRMGRPHECLETLARVTPGEWLAHYAWLSADLTLERSACLSQIGKFDEARKEAQLAYDVGVSAKLPLLALRARGFDAGILTFQGFGEEAWKMNSAGLQVTESSTSPIMRRYQFFSDLALDASILGLPQTAANLAGETAQIAARTNNAQISGYAWELRAQNELAVGDAAEATRSFMRADEVLARLGPNQAATIYRADWAADRAELLLAEGQGESGLAAMNQALPAINLTHSLPIILNYWAKRAQIESRMGRGSDALVSATNAVTTAKTALSKLKTRDERRAWQRTVEPAYLALVDSLLQTQRPSEALNQWLWLRAASETTYVPTIFSQPPPGLSKVRPETEVLIYVRLPHRYVVFTVGASAEDVQAVDIDSDPDSLDQMVNTYAALCADPNSTAVELQSLGSQLYLILVSPVLRGGHAELRIDTPPVLGRLPFAALVAPDGSFLGESERIAYLPEWWAVRTASFGEKVTPLSHLLLVDAGAMPYAGRPIPGSYDESEQLAVMFSHRDIISTPPGSLPEILRMLPSAAVFHFTGHAQAQGSSTLLGLGADPEGNMVMFTASSLEGLVLRRCQLAFLAACTTLGEEPGRIEEPFALASAFLRAGAADVIASRWNIDSESSRLFVLAFYSELLKGESPAVALERAQGAVRDQPKFHHPYFWSAFCLFEQ